MIEFIQPYADITLKLVTGMIGILAFLRITGKAQMAQLTPLDTVSAFVIGALVGGVLYNPDMSMWHILFALAVWTGFNMLVRFAMRSARLRHIIKGESVFLVKNGVINFKNFKRNSLEMEQFRLLLRQKGIFSMFEVEDVLFEANGAVTVLPTGKTRPCQNFRQQEIVYRAEGILHRCHQRSEKIHLAAFPHQCHGDDHLRDSGAPA